MPGVQRIMFLEQVLPMTQPVWPLPAQSWSWEKTITGSEGWLDVAPEGVLQNQDEVPPAACPL